MKTDMSSQAVTMRLKQTSELRRLCLALAGNRWKEKYPLRQGSADGSDDQPPVLHPPRSDEPVRE